jgi:histidinol-phosphate aminotransferase
MADVKKMMVPWLEGCEPYFSEHLEKAWEDRSLSRMMSNEGPFPPQKAIFDQLVEGAKLCHRYPDSLKHIKRKIGELNSGLGPDWVLLGNGSTEVLDMTMRAFLRPGDAIIQSNPCYGIYIKRAAIIGADTIIIDALDNWEYDIDKIEASISEKTRIVILANPNNPTGNLIPDSVYERLVKQNIIVISMMTG